MEFINWDLYVPYISSDCEFKDSFLSMIDSQIQLCFKFAAPGIGIVTVVLDSGFPYHRKFFNNINVAYESPVTAVISETFQSKFRTWFCSGVHH